MLKRYLPIILLVFVVFFVATSPDGAADVTRALGNAIQSLFDGLASFFQDLAT